MGQKVHPRGFRLGVIQGWNSKWFARKDYRTFLRQDVELRRYLMKRLKTSGIAKIEIERSPAALTVSLFTAKPGMVIGRGGAGVDELKKTIEKKYRKDKRQVVHLNIQEVDRPELNAQVMVQNIIEQIEKRLPFRRVLKQSVDQMMRAGAKGAKVMVAGRLNGAEIARTEKLAQGKIPLATLRADIDYARGAAHTTYGMIGIKVWVYRGEVFEEKSPVTKPENS
jgi:small subunit ribosomal protein S3